MTERTCQGCVHWPSFPGHIKCHGCARVYNDHYENANDHYKNIHQGKIVKLRVVFTQHIIYGETHRTLSGGYYDTEFICNDCELQNLYQLDFPVTESNVNTLLKLDLKNPSDGLMLCSNYVELTPNVACVRMEKCRWSISYNPSMEYISQAIYANTIGEMEKQGDQT